MPQVWVASVVLFIYMKLDLHFKLVSGFIWLLSWTTAKRKFIL